MHHLIEVDRLVKTYQMGEISFTALHGITLQIERGEFTAIMGASGSGKSTFMNLVGCLDEPTSGSYWLDGDEISTRDRDQLAEIRNSKIGFVFQNYQLLARSTAVQNVELPLLYSDVPRAEHRKRAQAALGKVGMLDRANRFPNQLSGGQQQRVAIARAIVNNPEIVLADEPTGALDMRTGVEIIAIFQELNRSLGMSIILVTHDPDLARCARRVIQFRDGYLIRDQRTQKPRSAAEELAQMPERPINNVVAEPPEHEAAS